MKGDNKDDTDEKEKKYRNYYEFITHIYSRSTDVCPRK